MEYHIQFSHEQQALILLDQRLLPTQEEYFFCKNTADIIFALREMVVRGAPAIGVTAAWGCVLAARELLAKGCVTNWKQDLDLLVERIAKARPTAVNLAWAVERMQNVLQAAIKERVERAGNYLVPLSLEEVVHIWTDAAKHIHAEDIAVNKRLGEYGASLLEDGDTILTHCNAGALATAGYGTALGVIYAAYAMGKEISVIADETRPFLQGARLTAYELHKAGVPVTVACDNACAFLMRQGKVQKVVVGADRIASNGDTANKIGTYGVALLARAHNIPFYIAAPLSTIDMNLADGTAIPIEERPSHEVTHIGGTAIVPEGVPVFNYAFDVTPAQYITGIITEAGILYPPYTKSIQDACVIK